MKVSSIKEAWEKVNEIFPTDYEQDYASTERAGYPIYRSAAEGHYYDYICDLGCRLEVNLDSSKMETVNIFIEEDNELPTESEIEDVASNQFVFEPERVTLIRFFVMGYLYESNANRRVYAVMKNNRSNRGYIAGELAAAYCKDKGIEWGSIKVSSVIEYSNSKNTNEGHFVIEAIVTDRVKE